MQKIAPMIDMRRSEEEKEESMAPFNINSVSDYPSGLCICLTHDELDKLGVDHSDWSVGDTFHLHAMARITSISERETDEGKNCRVEMQICELAGEDEDNENREYEKSPEMLMPL